MPVRELSTTLRSSSYAPVSLAEAGAPFREEANLAGTRSLHGHQRHRHAVDEELIAPSSIALSEGPAE